MKRPHLFVAFALLLSPIAFAADPAPLPDAMPWDLSALKEAPKFEWVDTKSPVRSLMYDGPAYRDLDTTQVFAYYATPGTLSGDVSKDKDLPAVVLIHGGGGTAFSEWCEMWAKRGYAAIAMDLAGSRPIEGKNPHDRKNRTRLERGGVGQSEREKFDTISGDKSEQWCYHAVANVILAHSLIRSFPEVDADRTAVTGISWGGYLTCMTASIDDRFKAAVPVYGCGFLHENSKWLNDFKRLGPDGAARWVAWYDPSSYLPSCKVPIFFVNGTNDFAYPLDSYMKSYDAVPGEKHIRIEVGMGHSHPAGWKPIEIGAFIDSKLTDGPALPTVHLIASASGGPMRVRALSSGSQLATVTNVHTTEKLAINGRKWINFSMSDPKPDRPADGKDSDLWFEFATAWPKNTTAWFVQITDQHGVMVTTPVTIIDAGPKVGQR